MSEAGSVRREVPGAQIMDGAGVAVLVVGDAAVSVDLAASTLERRGHVPRVARTVEHGLRAMRERLPDVVVLVLPFPGNPSRQILRRFLEATPTTPVITAGLDPEIPSAEVATALGARAHVTDYSQDPTRLLSAIGVVVGTRRDDVRLRYMNRGVGATPWEMMVGRCPAMQKVAALLQQICGRIATGAAATVLLTGETGTGKGLVAKCIHHNSARRAQPFVDVNCAAIPPTLIESELFGYEKGAFTDAKSMRVGFFEAADRGTLFLDEIPSVPIQLQAKLLTAIEEKQIRRVGGRVAVGVDVQIIAGAHDNLASMVERRTFRPDLYHRLNVIQVRLPPLRERGEDKLELAQAFVAAACSEYGVAPRTLGDDAKRLIMTYSWPGNVRELKNLIERIVLLENEDVIRAKHFQVDQRRTGVRVESEHGRIKVRLPSSGVSLEALEREIIKQAMHKSGGNISRAARYLSISRQTLIYRLKKHGLNEIEDRTSDAPPSSRMPPSSAMSTTPLPPASSRSLASIPVPRDSDGGNFDGS